MNNSTLGCWWVVIAKSLENKGIPRFSFRFESLSPRQRRSGICKNFTSPIHNFLKEIAEMLISVQARDLFISGIVIGLPLKFNTVSVVWKFGRL